MHRGIRGILLTNFSTQVRNPNSLSRGHAAPFHSSILSSSHQIEFLFLSVCQPSVVQFSHFSVKEFLTLARLVTSSGDVSRYHIDLEPAHTILAQACLSILLQSVDRDEENVVGKNSPLAEYAAECWVKHARFKDKEVSSCLRKAMSYLFDPDRPYFAAWLQLHNIDSEPSYDTSLYMTTQEQSDASPLYFAALCGFRDLVEDLVIKYPQHMNARSGCYATPLVAALAGGHSQTAKYLHDNGALLNIPNGSPITPLHSAAWYGDFESVQVLLDYKADINAQDGVNQTPLHYVSEGCFGSQNIPRFSDVARLLLEHGSDVNVLDENNKTPLHEAARNGRVGVVRVLLEHGADAGAEDKEGSTPLHAAAEGSRLERLKLEDEGRAEVVRILLEHGANVGAKDNKGRTPFQIARAMEYAREYDEIKELLSEYDAT